MKNDLMLSYRWQYQGGGSPIDWGPDGGTWTVDTSENSIHTKCSYSDFHLHLEYRCNNNRASGSDVQDWGNSGVYIFNLYEVQILDTWVDAAGYGAPVSPDTTLSMNATASVVTNKMSSALYAMLAPQKNWARSTSGGFNTLDIYFMAARFGGSVKKRNANISVLLNGNKVVDRVGLRSGTGGNFNTNTHPEGGSGGGNLITSMVQGTDGWDDAWKKQFGQILIQQHANAVEFKNIQINPTWQPSAPEDWGHSPMVLSSISPTQGNRGSTISMTITGEGFETAAGGVAVQLLYWPSEAPFAAGTAPIIGTNVSVNATGTQITCDFAIPSNASTARRWTVNVWNKSLTTGQFYNSPTWKFRNFEVK